MGMNMKVNLVHMEYHPKIPYYSYPASLGNQHNIHIELSFRRTDLALITPSMSIKMKVNLTHIQHHPKMPCY